MDFYSTEIIISVKLFMLTFSTSFISVNFGYGIHATTASDSFKLVKIDFNKAVFLNSKNNSELLRGK
jgi:hypothetical protein